MIRVLDRRGRAAHRRGAPGIPRAGRRVTRCVAVVSTAREAVRQASAAIAAEHADRPGAAGHRASRRTAGSSSRRRSPGMRPDARHHRHHQRARPRGGPGGGRARGAHLPAEAVHLRRVPRQARALPAVPRRPRRRAGTPSASATSTRRWPSCGPSRRAARPRKAWRRRPPDEIARLVRDATEGMTASEVAATLGVSRVTAWRYLERLADDNVVTRTSDYGRAGRPDRSATAGAADRPSAPRRASEDRLSVNSQR